MRPNETESGRASSSATRGLATPIRVATSAPPGLYDQPLPQLLLQDGPLGDGAPEWSIESHLAPSSPINTQNLTKLARFPLLNFKYRPTILVGRCYGFSRCAD